MNKKMRTVIFIACLAAFSGCTNNQSELEKENVTNHQYGIEQDIASAASEYAKKLDVITDAVSVNNDKQIFLAYKVKHMERFHLKKIEKQVKKNLEKEFPLHQIIVSSDLKLFLETNDLKEKLRKEKLSSKKLAKEIEKLNNLLNEKT